MQSKKKPLIKWLFYIVCFFNLITPSPIAASINTTKPVSIGNPGGGGGGGGPGAAWTSVEKPNVSKINILDIIVFILVDCNQTLIFINFSI